MGNKYKYNAFISYRHISPDKEIADKLQKKLENYKPPRSLSNGKRSGGWRVFRDETELPTSSNLSNDIKMALEESEYLIVICSKTTGESRWCMEEVEYFKELHDGNNSNIITLVADGNPEDVFPHALCNELIPVTDEFGNTTYQNHVIEPLAANVSGKSLKESLKKLNTEFLRIAAPLLGCGYDNLYNREHKKKIRRIFTIGGIVLSLLLLFAIYNSAMLWEINNQKVALAAANEDLQKKTEELNSSNENLRQSNEDLAKKTKEAEDNLVEANKQKKAAEDNLKEAEKQKKIAEQNLAEANRQKKIAEDNLDEANRQKTIAEENLEEANKQRNLAEENAQEANTQRGIAEENMRIAQENEVIANEQTRLAQIENSENLSMLSEKLWSTGDGIAAIQTALSALPGESSQRPVVSSVMRTLSNETGAFEQENFSAFAKLKCDDQITKLGYAGNGATVVSQDSTGIYFWDSKTGELKRKYLNKEFNDYNSMPNIHFYDTGVYEAGTLGAYKYAIGIYARDENDYLEGYKKYETEEKPLFNTDVLIESYGSVYKVDGVNGEVLWKISTDDFSSGTVDITDTKIILSEKIYNYDDKSTDIKIKVFDKFTGENIKILEVSDDINTDINISAFDNFIDITNEKAYYHSSGLINKDKIIAFDISENKLMGGHVVYDSVEDWLYTKHSTSVVEKMQLYNDELYIVKTHWDTFEYTFLTDVIVIDKYGQKKWSYLYETDHSNQNYVGINKIDAVICNNFCNIIAVTKGNKVVLLNYDTGEHVYTYELESIVENLYCSENGLLFLITSDGYEVMIPVRGIDKEKINQPELMPMIKLHKFMNQHKLYAYFNHKYAVTNEKSNEIYLYSDIENVDYQKLFTDENNISKVHINDSQTYMAIDLYEKICIVEINTKHKYELICSGSDEYLRGGTFMTDNLFAVVDSENNINIYDVRTGAKVFEKKIEKTLFSDDYFAVEGNFVFKSDYGAISVLDKEFKIKSWTPEKQNEKYPQIMDKGYIHNIYNFDKTGKILGNISYGNSYALELYDVNIDESVTLEIDLSDSSKIVSAEWINDELLIAFADNVIRRFDAVTGRCKKDLISNIPSIVSVVPLNDKKYIGIICKDSILYKVGLEDGIIYDSVNLENDYIKSAVQDKAKVEILPQYNCLIFSGWNKEFSKNHAYVIDIDTFDVRYDISGYVGYYLPHNSLIVESYNQVGSYPLYTAETLVKKAQKYIAE